jgi:hypothetical protein
LPGPDDLNRYNPEDLEPYLLNLVIQEACEVNFESNGNDPEGARVLLALAMEKIPRWVLSAIEEGPGTYDPPARWDGRPRDSSPSGADAAVCYHLARAGLTDDQIRGIYKTFPIGALGKYSRAGQGDNYLKRTLGEMRGRLAQERSAKLKTKENIDSHTYGDISERIGTGDRQGATQTEILIGYADDARLFHTPDGEAHATIRIGEHEENWPVKSRRFDQVLRRRFYEVSGRAPSAQAITDARATIAARAVFDGPEMPVHLRVAGHENAVYVDLVNDRWEAVEVTPAGWRVLSGDALPVRFVRKDNAAHLPYPARGGSVEDLKPFLNVRTEEDFRLLVGWMVGALSPNGPYPLLVVEGEQGSAKSTTVRVARSVVDPAEEPLRAPPRDERDLAIAASGNWTPALDNLSGVRPWLSDALCRLATGGGFATRELYSDDREIVFSHKRPLIINGIDHLAAAGDLRDRSIVLDLPPIPPGKKRTEREFYRDLEEVRPRVLGALLDAVSAALRNLDAVELADLPRMADFAVWVAAAEGVLPWESGGFIEAYAGNRADANEVALDNDPVAVAVRELMADREEWNGTATQLYAALSELVDEDVRRSRAWPTAPNSLSNRMKRIAPVLRTSGAGAAIEYLDEREPGGSRRRRKRLKKMAGGNRPGRPERPVGRGSPANRGEDPGTPVDDAGRPPDGEPARTVPQRTPANGSIGDGGDGRDGGIGPFSGAGLPVQEPSTAGRGGGHGDDGHRYTQKGSLGPDAGARRQACIHDVPGGCWLCRKKRSESGQQAPPPPSGTEGPPMDGLWLLWKVTKRKG